MLHRGTPISRWSVVAWSRQRFLPPHAEQFAEELVAHGRRDYPGRQWLRKAPPLPRPGGSAG